MPELARRATRAVEVVHRAEIGVERVVPALGAADRPGAAGVARRAARGVVAALAVRDARSGGPAAGRRRRTRARRARGSTRCDAGEAAPGAGEELVPGAEAGALTLDVELEDVRRLRRPGAVARRAGRAPPPLVERLAPEQRRPLRRARRARSAWPASTLRRSSSEPGRDAVDPRRDAVVPAARRVDARTSRPSGRFPAAAGAPPASALPARPVADGRAERRRGRRGRRRADTATRSPTMRLTGYRPQSTGGLERPESGFARRSSVFGGGSDARDSQRGATGHAMSVNLVVRRHPAASDLAARRPAGAGGVRLRRLARRRPGSRGGRCCRSGRRTRHGSPYALAVGVRRLAGAARQPASAPVVPRRAAGSRRATRTGRRLGRASRRRTRSPTRCGSSASGRAARVRAPRAASG